MWPTLFKHAQATISLTRYQRYATYPWPASDILEGGGDARASIRECGQLLCHAVEVDCVEDAMATRRQR